MCLNKGNMDPRGEVLRGEVLLKQQMNTYEI